MPRKLRGKRRWKIWGSKLYGTLIDLENPATENSEVGKQHNELSSVEADALPSTETQKPKDPAIGT